MKAFVLCLAVVACRPVYAGYDSIIEACRDVALVVNEDVEQRDQGQSLERQLNDLEERLDSLPDDTPERSVKFLEAIHTTAIFAAYDEIYRTPSHFAAEVYKLCIDWEEQ